MSDLPPKLSIVTIADVLEFAEIKQGDPQIYASKRALKKPATWAHVLSEPSSIGLLDGGEIVLTTGAGWPTDESGVQQVAQSLMNSAVSAIVLELGQTFAAAPKALISACAKNDIALIVLHRVVRFVQVTQRLHRIILAAQNEALEARDDVHRMLTDLGLNRSPVDFVIAQISKTLLAPVILENLAGEVVAWSDVPGKAAAQMPLTSWGNKSSLSELKAKEAEGKVVRVPVEARGTRWGTLTALEGPPHPAGKKTVLELGAFALALGRLSDPEGAEWVRQSSKKLVDDLLSGRYRNDTDLTTQLAAAGLPIDDRSLIAVTISSVGDFGSHASLERATLETALRRAVAPEGKTIISDAPGGTHGGLLALISLPLLDSRIDQSRGRIPGLASRLDRELEMLVPRTAASSWRAHLAFGSTTTGVQGLIASMEGVLTSGYLPSDLGLARVTLQLEARQPLGYLLRNFQGTQVLQQFVNDMLGPVLEYDRQKGRGNHGDLVRVLGCYLENPSNRSLAAERANLSRSVFYQRLSIIEDLLGVDLADGNTIAALLVALTAHRL